jgi:hypothetical protein
MQQETRRKKPKSKLGLVPVSEIAPSPQNEQLYRPVTNDDPEIQHLAESIREFGVREPLVLTRDKSILSGHRRYAAAKLAGLDEVPCRFEDLGWESDPDECLKLLREFNRQRDKSLDEKLREELLTTDRDAAYFALLEERDETNHLDLPGFEIRGSMNRCRISKAKEPFLAAVQDVLADRRAYWPLSDRQIHYALLNNPPLRHSSKPDSTYDNSVSSYRALVDLVTRARVVGQISMSAIADETRPVTTNRAFRDSREFIRKELDSMFDGYWRDIQQSQPSHIELIGEKNTIASILRPIAKKYRIPLTISRGFCSLPPRAAIVDRFQKSGRAKLVLLIASDFDPDGEEIAQSLPRSIRDDFGIPVEKIHAVKVALTSEQARELSLPNALPVKQTSTNFRKFKEQHGTDGWELEALRPEQLQEVVSDAIESVCDMEFLNQEIAAEQQDAVQLAAIRATVTDALAGLTLDGGLDQ